MSRQLTLPMLVDALQGLRRNVVFTGGCYVTHQENIERMVSKMIAQGHPPHAIEATFNHEHMSMLIPCVCSTRGPYSNSDMRLVAEVFAAMLARTLADAFPSVRFSITIDDEPPSEVTVYYWSDRSVAIDGSENQTCG